MRITQATTLAELANELITLGIVSISMHCDRVGGVHRLAIVITNDGPLYGSGNTEAEAIEEAFQQRRAELAAKGPDENHRRTDCSRETEPQEGEARRLPS